MMKKFLSSLLALTMILSLVIVPANAEGPDDPAPNNVTGVIAANALSISGAPSSAMKIGDTATLVPSISDEALTYNSTVVKTPSTTYTWKSNDSTIVSVDNSGKITANKAGEATITCQATMTGTIDVYDDAKQETVTYTVTGKQSKSVEVTVTSKNDLFAADIVSINFGGNTYSVRNGEISVPKHNDNEFTAGTWTANLKAGSTFKLPENHVTFKNNQLTVTGTKGETATIKVKPIAVTVVLSDPTYPVISKDGTTQITATYNGPESNVSYTWYRNNNPIEGQNTKTLTWTPTSQTVGNTYSFKCVVSYDPANDSNVVESATKDVTVEDATYSLHPSEEITIYLAKGATDNSLKKILLYPDKTSGRPVDDAAYTFSPSNTTKVSVSKDGTLTALAGGEVTITVTAKDKNNSGATQYKGKVYTKQVKVVVSALDYTLDDVESGSKAQDYTLSTLKEYAEKVIADSLNLSASAVTVNTLTAKSPAVSTIGKFEMTSRYLTFTPPTKAIGKAQIVMTATTSALGSFDITFIIPVTPIKTTYESQYPQPSGTSSNYKYSVDVPDGYKEYYVVAKNPSKAPTDYSEKLSGTKSSYSGNSLYPLSGSDFDKSGKCELYVVTYDKDGTAYCGVITVYQKSYDIKYSVVAGESVTFSQKDFESFLEDIADDSSDYNSRKDTLELSYVKFSLPNSTREGVLYEGKSKIDRNDKVEDLDKVTFESVAKAKDTITISFTAYGKLYKDGASKGKDVDYSGNVVISVVKEDIVFEVGVNSAIKLGSDKFIDFLRDSDKSYKKADLDYVTFDVGKNSAITSYFNGTGALYRYYNGSTGVNSTVSAKDEFYYNPKTSSKHYDLDDVAYVTSKFAKVGDIVYIPFTAYGTKSGQKAEGTIAIKVKQTMSFVDVRPGDYFYDSVQWAVNLDITKGTSATTFSPKQGCTRAQIVTFLWRAANSPAPRSSTSKFTDVYATAHADYMKAINWATEQGITTGTGNGKFSPDATCTRAQIVTFLYRFKNNPAVYGSLNFSDVNKTEHAAFYNAILWAVNNKITTGYGNGIFDPNGTCNRGDAVTFLYRALA